MAKRRINAKWLGLIAAIGLVAAILVNILMAGTAGRPRLLAWLASLVAAILLSGCIGMAIKNSWTGAIESARNRVSLSRLQMLIWSLLVLSAFLTAGASNFLLADNLTALNITIPRELLAAMGIAATSLVAAPAVLSLKAVPEPEAATAAAAGVSAGIHRRANPRAASWLDIFRGDEAGNCDTPDLSKIQQFLITLGLVGLYGCLIGQQFLDPGAITAMPPLDENFIWLLGISHAGYLAYKAVPHPAATTNADAAPGAVSEDDDAVG